MPSLAVTAQEQNLVFDMFGAILIQPRNLVVEALPLSEGMLAVLVRGVSPVDQAEILRCLLWVSDVMDDSMMLSSVGQHWNHSHSRMSKHRLNRRLVRNTL